MLKEMSILGAFAKLQKATIGFVKSVCLSVRPSILMEHFGSQWKNFDDILILQVSGKCYNCLSTINLVSHTQGFRRALLIAVKWGRNTVFTPLATYFGTTFSKYAFILHCLLHSDKRYIYPSKKIQHSLDIVICFNIFTRFYKFGRPHVSVCWAILCRLWVPDIFNHDILNVTSLVCVLTREYTIFGVCICACVRTLK